MTDLLYVANARVPSRKAHVYQILQMCDAFVEADDDVELVVPNRRIPESAPASAQDYYDTPLDFEITRLPCLDLLWLAPRVPNAVASLLFYIQTATFSIVALGYAARASSANIYSRARLFTILSALFLDSSLVMEVHRFPSRDWVAYLVGEALNRTDGVVVITEGLREDWQGVTQTPIIVEPDAVRLERFDIATSREELRDDLGLPRDVHIACYAGSFSPWKGVDTLVRAAEGLPDGFVVCLVGGSADQQERLATAAEQIPGKVHFAGYVDPEQVPKYLVASDVLVVPNSAQREISARYTSPLKLFEYMAAGRPIVASDLPSLREVLNSKMALFATPDDPDSFATAIKEAVGEAGTERAEVARREVLQYTWQARAERIRNEFFTTGGGGG